MLKRVLFTILLLTPFAVGAVNFPGGIDWTNPSPDRYVQSLYLNMLGRAPTDQETRTGISSLRRSDNRTARLRLFEAILGTPEYRNAFTGTGGDWQIFRAPDYNYNNGNGFWRYKAGVVAPDGFSTIPGGSRGYSDSIASTLAHYFNAYCYRGEPCVDNPELARERTESLANATHQSTTGNTSVHACADTTRQTAQFKWVATNGTTYPRGINNNTICMDNYYYQAEQLILKRYDCDTGFSHCRRTIDLDLRASRTGNDNSGNPAWFFRDGSRLVSLNSDPVTNSSNSRGVTNNSNSEAQLLGDVHACADPAATTSEFSWRRSSRDTVAKGIGGNTVCMQDHYYVIKRLSLERFSCQRGYNNCQPDPQKNLTASRRTSVNGKPGLLFANGDTLSLTQLGAEAGSSTNDSSRTNTRTTNNDSQINRSRVENSSATAPANTGNQRSRPVSGSACANPTQRVSQFRWVSDGLSSWPDGVDGRIICLNNNYYEIGPSNLRHYTCQSNFSNCTANANRDLRVTSVSEDGNTRSLSNGDEITLISR